MPYKELCLLYKNAREEYFRAFDDAASFAGLVYTSMKAYMGLKDDKDELLRIVPNTDKFDEKRTYRPEETVNFGASNDWEFTILLSLYVKAYPSETLRFNFFYKKDGDIIFYRFMEGLKDYEVKQSEIESHLIQVCFPDMEASVEKFYHDRLTTYSKDMPTQRKIGLK